MEVTREEKDFLTIQGKWWDGREVRLERVRTKRVGVSGTPRRDGGRGATL